MPCRCAWGSSRVPLTMLHKSLMILALVASYVATKQPNTEVNVTVVSKRCSRHKMQSVLELSSRRRTCRRSATVQSASCDLSSSSSALSTSPCWKLMLPRCSTQATITSTESRSCRDNDFTCVCTVAVSYVSATGKVGNTTCNIAMVKDRVETEWCWLWSKRRPINIKRNDTGFSDMRQQSAAW